MIGKQRPLNRTVIGFGVVLTACLAIGIVMGMVARWLNTQSFLGGPASVALFAAVSVGIFVLLKKKARSWTDWLMDL